MISYEFTAAGKMVFCQEGQEPVSERLRRGPSAGPVAHRRDRAGFWPEEANDRKRSPSMAVLMGKMVGHGQRAPGPAPGGHNRKRGGAVP
jgi:hypothetical protein